MESHEFLQIKIVSNEEDLETTLASNEKCTVDKRENNTLQMERGDFPNTATLEDKIVYSDATNEILCKRKRELSAPNSFLITTPKSNQGTFLRGALQHSNSFMLGDSFGSNCTSDADDDESESVNSVEAISNIFFNHEINGSHKMNYFQEADDRSIDVDLSSLAMTSSLASSCSNLLATYNTNSNNSSSLNNSRCDSPLQSPLSHNSKFLQNSSSLKSFRKWLFGIAHVDFDSSLGPKLSLLLPKTTSLTTEEERSICFSSLPDYTMANDESYFTFRVRIKGKQEIIL